MRRSSLAVAIVLVTLSSGCLFGPTIECDPSIELTQAECDKAAEAALAKVSSEVPARRIVVRSACRREAPCPARVALLVLRVEISFSGTNRQAQVLVDRESWEAGEVFYPSLPPSNP